MQRRKEKQTNKQTVASLPALSATRLGNELDERTHRAARHALRPGVALIATIAHHAGDIYVQPRCTLRHELAQECSGSAGSAALALAQVVQIVTVVVAHLVAVVLEQWHAPHPITGLRARLVDRLPQFVVAGKHARHAIAQRYLDGTGQGRNVQDELWIEAAKRGKHMRSTPHTPSGLLVEMLTRNQTKKRFKFKPV